MRSTTLRVARAKRAAAKSLPEKVGRHSKRVDTALPGKRTRLLYDRLSRKEANVLAQLRTGMAKLNTYLHRIRAASSDQCACGQARETVEHFLFRCRQWTEHPAEMVQCADIHSSNISFWEESRHQMTRTGPRTCKRCGQQYGSQFRRGVWMQTNSRTEQANPTILNPTNTTHLVPRRGSMLQPPRRRGIGRGC